MTASMGDRLRKLIRGQEWVRGAVNYDEDLHFSTFYLRASWARHTGSLYPGYTHLVAFYEGFNEQYYLLKSECHSTATAVVGKALRQPAWLPSILVQVRRRSDLLARVFSPQTSPALLAGLPDADLLSLYRRHAASHRALYRYARLPEALDRGVSYFTNYLMSYLRELGMGRSEREETFAVLSQPAVPSVLAQELLEFDAIVRQARADPRVSADLAHFPTRPRMFLSPALLQRLSAHREKWKFLSYHGYGRRELTTLGEYIGRLVEQARKPDAGDAADPLRRWEQAGRARQEVFHKVRMDRKHRALFETYPEIGAVKLYRRYAQLRNFYYLDMLLAEAARRLGVTEWTVRCMLPEEVVACLKAGRLVKDAVRERGTDFVYALLPDEECVVAGSEARELRRLLQAPARGRHSPRVLKGTAASRGTAVGPCKVIIRADDHRADFARGSIVVSESTDPDLVGFLKNAGGVLTEQGGVTSHAAIICRELGVPTIIGIEGLLDRVRDGDVVKVDADRGLVTLARGRAVPPPGTVYSPGEASAPERIGAKAYTLGVVRSLGFPVPEYVVLSYEAVKRLVDRPSSNSCRRLVQWTLEQLNLPAGGKLAVRSSALNEDRESGSRAGEYRSLLNVGRDQLAAALAEFVQSNRVGKDGSRYRGSVIVQRMIAAEYAGVCLTVDGRAGNGNRMVIEHLAGSNEAVTQGTAVPERVVVDRLTGDILENHRRGNRLPPPRVNLQDLMRQFLTLEAAFGKPLDVEWALTDRQLYILQARPIVPEAAGRR